MRRGCRLIFKLRALMAKPRSLPRIQVLWQLLPFALNELGCVLSPRSGVSLDVLDSLKNSLMGGAPSPLAAFLPCCE